MHSALVTPLMASLFIAIVVEMVLYFGATETYARLARLPFGASRRLVIHPRAREALRGPAAEGGAGYRAPAMGEIDLGRLSLPNRLEVENLVLHFAPARGFAVARQTFSFSQRAYGLVRVDLLLEDGGIELRPRFMILGWPSMLVLAPVGAIAVMASTSASDWTEAFVMGALFIALNVVVGLIVGRGRLEEGVSHIEREVQNALTSVETR